MRIVILALITFLHLVLPAQVAVSTGSYFQDFGTVDVNSWTNNSTYAGWYMVGTFQSHINVTTASPSNTGGFYTYECNNNNDQKIGSRASGGSGTLRYGVVLQNTTGSAVSHVRVAYKGYQLSLAQNGATNVIGFDYVVGTVAPNISAGGGTAVAPLNFTQLQSNPSSGSNQVMGYPCTQVTNKSSCITVSIPNNSYILLRWTDVDDAGNDHHMAIDDIDVQFLSTNLTVNSATICSPQTATLTVTGATNYTWTPAATLSSASGSVVTANPSATTVYTVSGSVLSCPERTTTATVTVNSSAPLVVNSQTICSGASATLTASGSTGYTWTPATGLSSTTGSTVVANPANTTVYTVIGASGGCTASPATSTVTILPTPVLTAASQTICSSSSATLTANGAGSYTWSPAATLSSTNGTSVIANPAITTIYTLNGSNGACSAAPITLTVSVIANSSITVNSATICPAGTATLIASGADTYNWSQTTNLSINGNTVIANPSVTTVYTVTGTFASCAAAAATTTVTVLSSPTISVNSATICASAAATLNASGASSYTWNTTATSNSIIVSPATTTAYTVVGSAGSCTSSAVGVVTITSFENADFSYPSVNFCSNASDAFPIITGKPGGIFSSSSPDLPLDQVTGIISFRQAALRTYTITYTTQGACPGSKSFVLNVNPSPTLSVNSRTACEGQNAILTASTNVKGGSFQWSPGNTTGNAITVAPSASRDYTVTYALNGCTDTKVASVTINPKPVAAIEPSSLPVTEGQVISLKASGGTNYSWDNNTTNSIRMIEPKETTNYCVTVSDNYGCSSYTCITIDMIMESTLYVPNVFTPNGDGLNDVFEVPHSNISEFTIRIFNRWGQLLFESHSIDTSWDGTFKGQEVSVGVYVYSINAKGEDKNEFIKRGHVTVLR